MGTGPIVVCVINLKGGVGKSTITALLSRYALERRKKDVLAIDLDPQANLSQAFMGTNYRPFLRNGDPSIVEIFNGYIPPSKAAPHPSAIVAHTGIYNVETINGKRLDLIPSRFDFADNLVQAARPDPRVLARHLAGNFADKELIIIDCAPTESILTQAAYHASSEVLIPVKPEFFATIGFPLLRQSLDAFRKSNKSHSIDVAGVVINNAFYHGGNDGGPEKADAIKDIRAEAKRNGWIIYKKQLPHSRGFPKRMRGNNSYPGNSVEFDTFANEFFKSIGM